MRTPIRRAALGAVAVALVGALGLTSSADPVRNAAVDAGLTVASWTR